MNRKFEKKISLYNMIIDWVRNLKWIVLISILVCLLGISALYIKSKLDHKEMIQPSSENELIDSNYICSSLILISPNRSLGNDQVIGVGSYLSAMISNTVITATINDLKLDESFIDIFHKMNWTSLDYTIKLSLISPVKEIDGYQLDEILDNLIMQGQKYIENNFNIQSFMIIDKPYYENPLINDQTTLAVNDKSGFSISPTTIILLAIISFVLSSGFFMIKFLFNPRITNMDEVIDYLDIPVFANDIERVTNIILNSRNKYKSICIAGILDSDRVNQVSNNFLDDMRKRCKNVELLDLKNMKYDMTNVEQLIKKTMEDCDYLIVCAPSLTDNALSMFSTGICDSTIVLIEDALVHGDKAIQLKRELDMNGAKVLGAIYIK